MEYQMEHSNECKKNFVAVYDGSSAIENLKAKFCSTVANDVMLDNGVGVVRMWADEKSRLSRFRMLFTSFVDREYQSLWRRKIENRIKVKKIRVLLYYWSKYYI